MNYLLADTVTGVWEVESLEGERCKQLSQELFLESLTNLRDGQTIGCAVDSEYYSTIDAEYGIQFSQ